MVKQTKKLSTKTTVAQINATDKFPITDANGVVSLVTLATIKAAIMDGASLNAMYDGVFIMYHRKSDDYPLMVKPHKWTSIQSSGEIADGVVVVEGGKCLVVAPTESASKLTWSSAAISGGGTTTSDRVTAINDWNGKTNTAQQIAHSTSSAVTNTASYAPGFCNLYSRANANGKGLTAGKWWLPSLGEMMMIYANMTKINYALSLINGATQLVEDAYWTSTENSATLAWLLTLDFGLASNTTKASHTYRVRAVSAFIA
jgi:phage baseplate assembly protein gpV